MLQNNFGVFIIISVDGLETSQKFTKLINSTNYNNNRRHAFQHVICPQQSATGYVKTIQKHNVPCSHIAIMAVQAFLKATHLPELPPFPSILQ